MPYISQCLQEDFEKGLDNLTIINTPGQLNYILTRVCQAYLQDKCPLSDMTNSYQDYNDVVGALESCKLEFYRRAVAPFEDEKIQQNGDVY